MGYQKARQLFVPQDGNVHSVLQGKTFFHDRLKFYVGGHVS